MFYVHSKTLPNALQLARRKALLKFGKCKINDVFIKKGDKWNKIMLSRSEPYTT